MNHRYYAEHVDEIRKSSSAAFVSAAVMTLQRIMFRNRLMSLDGRIKRFHFSPARKLGGKVHRPSFPLGFLPAFPGGRPSHGKLCFVRGREIRRVDFDLGKFKKKNKNREKFEPQILFSYANFPSLSEATIPLLVLSDLIPHLSRISQASIDPNSASTTIQRNSVGSPKPRQPARGT